MSRTREPKEQLHELSEIGIRRRLIKNFAHLQVLLEKGLKAWMSARHTPACAVLESGALAVLGGFSACNKPLAMDVCLTFNISRSGAQASILAPLNAGALCACKLQDIVCTCFLHSHCDVFSDTPPSCQLPHDE